MREDPETPARDPASSNQRGHHGDRMKEGIRLLGFHSTETSTAWPRTFSTLQDKGRTPPKVILSLAGLQVSPQAQDEGLFLPWFQSMGPPWFQGLAAMVQCWGGGAARPSQGGDALTPASLEGGIQPRRSSLEPEDLVEFALWGFGLAWAPPPFPFYLFLSWKGVSVPSMPDCGILGTRNLFGFSGSWLEGSSASGWASCTLSPTHS